jgi:hypothetical protein
MEFPGLPKAYGWMGSKKYSLLLYNSSYKDGVETYLFQQPLVKIHPTKIHQSSFTGGLDKKPRKKSTNWFHHVKSFGKIF